MFFSIGTTEMSFTAIFTSNFKSIVYSKLELVTIRRTILPFPCNGLRMSKFADNPKNP